MQLLIQWPYSLYDEGYCAVIVSHDGGLASLQEEAVYAVGRHSDSGLQCLLGVDGRAPKPPFPAIRAISSDTVFTLDHFALYKDGVELPHTGTLAEAGIADRDWLTLDYVAVDRHGGREPASDVKAEHDENDMEDVDVTALRTLICEEIAERERQQLDMTRLLIRHSRKNH